jgi:hypothetical protein
VQCAARTGNTQGAVNWGSYRNQAQSTLAASTGAHWYLEADVCKARPFLFAYGRHSEIRARSLGGKSLKSIQSINDVRGLKPIFESCLTAIGGDLLV